MSLLMLFEQIDLLLGQLLFRPSKMERNFVFVCILVFVFHAKSGTANNNQSGSSDIQS